MVRLTFVCLMMLLTAASAQTLTVGSGWPTPGLVAVRDVPLDSGRAGLGIFWRGSPGLVLHLRHTATWGPLGNLVIDADAAGTAGGSWTAALSGRAVLGPASLRLRVAGHNADGLPLLRPPDDAFLPTVLADGPVTDLGLGVTWRVARDLLVVNDASLVLGGRGTALRNRLELRMPRLVGPHELRLRVTVLQPSRPEAMQPWTSFGAGLRIDRGRSAAWGLMIQAGGTPDGRAAPGLETDVTWDDLRLALRLEPWRDDVPALELNAGWSAPLGGGSLDVSGRLSGSPAAAALQVRWELPLPALR